jgi:calcineurin-like phosphoesterase family protein
MLKPLKFNGPEDSFFWTSDTHFNHDRPFIYGPRNYPDVKSHDEDLIKTWNERVKDTDTVFHLGDFYCCSNKSSDVLNVIHQLNFNTLYLIWGNHPASVKQLFQEEIESQYGLKDVEIYPLIKNIGLKKIIFLGFYSEIYVNSQHVCMSHFAHRSWHKNGKGSWFCCGHSHKNDKGINPDCLDSNILDIGVDNFGGPVSFAEIKQIMNKKSVKVTDHH